MVRPRAAILHAAIERLATYFADRGSRAAILARRALGRSRPTDRALRDRLVREMRGETRIDGSLGGRVVPTIWLAHQLMDLGHRGDQVGTIRVVGWVLNLQQETGAYGEGCTPTAHDHHACEHYLGGFFSPAPQRERIAPVTLPDGTVYRAEGPARFAVSCLALRAVLRAGHENRKSVIRHLESVVDLQDSWKTWGGYFAPDVVTAALHALALAPPPYREVLPRAAAFVAEHQAADGTWPGTDLFQTLAALSAAGTHESRIAMRRAMPALLSHQESDGTFGPVARDERALIGLQVMLLARRELELRETAPV
ncbi:MAG: hypothetical protein HKM89_06570 [Gemmatimonadales bacterium]|nr:hypothetical protein [Gemmatimonadales bacterium]